MVESAASNSKGDQFAVSLVTPWIKGTMDIDESFLQIDMPNTVLFGMLPAGKSKDSTPLSGVINVYTSNSYKIGAINLGSINCLVRVKHDWVIDCRRPDSHLDRGRHLWERDQDDFLL